MKNIEDTKPIDVLADRVWAGDRYHYPGIERMIAELKRLREIERRYDRMTNEEVKHAIGFEAELNRLRSVQTAADRLVEAASRAVELLGPGPTGAATLNLAVQAYRKERAS